jgi:hypothetical protein
LQAFGARSSVDRALASGARGRPFESARARRVFGRYWDRIGVCGSATPAGSENRSSLGLQSLAKRLAELRPDVLDVDVGEAVLRRIVQMEGVPAGVLEKVERFLLGEWFVQFSVNTAIHADQTF